MVLVLVQVLILLPVLVLAINDCDDHSSGNGIQEHGIYDDTLEYFGDKSGVSLVDILKSNYSIYPIPYMISSIWDLDKIEVEKTKIMNTEYGFDMDKLFMTKNQQFENYKQMITIIP